MCTDIPGLCATAGDSDDVCRVLRQHTDLIPHSLQTYFASVSRDTRLARPSYLLEWDLSEIVSESHHRLTATAYGRYDPGSFPEVPCIYNHSPLMDVPVIDYSIHRHYHKYSPKPPPFLGRSTIVNTNTPVRFTSPVTSARYSCSAVVKPF
jgi:hypothetical protein